MVPDAGCLHALAHQLPEIDGRFFPPRFLIPGAPGAQHLLDRLREAIGIAEHQAVKLLLLAPPAIRGAAEFPNAGG